jgi:hypothetical protein
MPSSPSVSFSFSLGGFLVLSWIQGHGAFFPIKREREKKLQDSGNGNPNKAAPRNSSVKSRARGEAPIQRNNSI